MDRSPLHVRSLPYERSRTVETETVHDERRSRYLGKTFLVVDAAMNDDRTDDAETVERTTTKRPTGTGLTNRRGFVALAGSVTAASLAGCTAGVLGSEGSSGHDRQLTVELTGDGPYDPVDLHLGGNTVDVELTAEPGDELDDEDGDFEEDVEVSIEHDDEIEVVIEWEVDDVTVRFELDQELWNRTTATLGFTVADGTVTFDADLDLEMIESATELTLSDQRPEDEWTFEIGVEVDEVEETDVEFEVDRGDDGDDDGDNGGPPWR